MFVCLFATSILALANNAIGVASGEPGEARLRIGAANPRQVKFRQTKFRQTKFRQINFSQIKLAKLSFAK